MKTTKKGYTNMENQKMPTKPFSIKKMGKKVEYTQKAVSFELVKVFKNYKCDGPQKAKILVKVKKVCGKNISIY